MKIREFHYECRFEPVFVSSVLFYPQFLLRFSLVFRGVFFIRIYCDPRVETSPRFNVFKA